MMKRLAALLLALLFTGSPVAFATCQIDCASSMAAARAADARSMNHHGSGAQPSCHESSGSGHPACVGSRSCDHHGAWTSPTLVKAHAYRDTVEFGLVSATLTDDVSAALTHATWRVPKTRRIEIRLSLPLLI